MSKIIRVVIEMNYDLDAFTDQDQDDAPTAEDFVENYLDDYVYEDLTDLMRGDRLSTWSEITIIDTDSQTPPKPSHDYNLGYEEAREMVIEVIEQMRDSYDYHNPTLDELEDRIQ